MSCDSETQRRVDELARIQKLISHAKVELQMQKDRVKLLVNRDRETIEMHALLWQRDMDPKTELCTCDLCDRPLH